MFTRSRMLAALIALALVPAAWAGDLTAGMKKGPVALKQAGALAFGPEGVLFVADAPNSTVYAIATGDTKPADAKTISIAKVDEVIGGLLGNIQAVLSAGSSGDPTYDPATEQTRIDTAVATIDDLASSTQFGGQPLLDGTFIVQDAQGSVTLPSFQSQNLGGVNAGEPGAPSQALSSLVSGGTNDLSSGNLSTAGQIVSTAVSEVNTAQRQISQYQSAPLQADLSVVLPPPIPGQFSLADAMYLAAAQMLSNPLLSATAVANSSPQNVLPLLMP